MFIEVYYNDNGFRSCQTTFKNVYAVVETSDTYIIHKPKNVITVSKLHRDLNMVRDDTENTIKPFHSSGFILYMSENKYNDSKDNDTECDELCVYNHNNGDVRNA